MKASRALRAGNLSIILCLLLGAGLFGSTRPAIGRTKSPVEMGDPDDTGNAATLPRSYQAPKQMSVSLGVASYSGHLTQRETLTMLFTVIRVHFLWLKLP